MNQLLLGASFAFALGVLLYLARRLRAGFAMLIAIPILMALGMLWAVMPDVPRAFGFYELYDRLHRNPKCDIFFWHYTIDQIETDSRWYGALFVLMFACLLFAAWRELYLIEQNKELTTKGTGQQSHNHNNSCCSSATLLAERGSDSGSGVPELQEEENKILVDRMEKET